jgi:hypothetical protein
MVVVVAELGLPIGIVPRPRSAGTAADSMAVWNAAVMPPRPRPALPREHTEREVDGQAGLRADGAGQRRAGVLCGIKFKVRGAPQHSDSA